MSQVSLSLPGGLVTAARAACSTWRSTRLLERPTLGLLSYSEPGTGGSRHRRGARPARRGEPQRADHATRSSGSRPRSRGNGHFGSRLVFASDKTLFVTLGERQQGGPAQDLNSHLGKVVRINRDGTRAGRQPLRSAHRRGPASGATATATRRARRCTRRTGELWVSEHGPQGGDEINIALAGRNYGWPVVSYGCDYGATYPGNDNTSCRIGGTGGVHTPNYVEPLTFWVPISIAPSGMMFYSGSLFPEWQGNLFMGSLAGTALWRLTVDRHRGHRTRGSSAVVDQRAHSRCAQGPDGAIYFIEETNGRIVRITR